MSVLILVVMAFWLWMRDLAWLPSAAETLPALAGLPLFWFFARPIPLAVPQRQWLGAALLFLVLGLLLDFSPFLALSFTALVGSLVVPSRRVWLHLPLVLFSFPWIALEGAAFGWWLRLSSAWATELGYRALGVSVERMGTQVFLPGVCLDIAAPCAGLSVLQVALVGGYALLLWDRRLTRLEQLPVALLCLVALAWLANVLRLVLLAALALGFGVSVARGPLHALSGLVVFIAAFQLLRLRRP